MNWVGKTQPSSKTPKRGKETTRAGEFKLRVWSWRTDFLQPFDCFTCNRVEAIHSPSKTPLKYSCLGFPVGYFPCNLSLNFSFIATLNIFTQEVSILKTSVSSWPLRVLGTPNTHSWIQQKFKNMKLKESSTLPPPSFFSCVYEMNLSEASISVAKEMSQAVNCSLGICSALRNWEKQQRGDICLCLDRQEGQPGSRIPFSSRHFSSCLGRFPLRTWSSCTYHWLSVFTQSTGSVQHTTPTTTGRLHIMSPYNFKAIDPYLNRSLKSIPLCRLFSSSLCCRQPMCQIMHSQPSWSCAAETLEKQKHYETGLTKSPVDSLKPKPGTRLLQELPHNPHTIWTR